MDSSCRRSGIIALLCALIVASSYFLYREGGSGSREDQERQEKILNAYFVALDRGLVVRPIFERERYGWIDERGYRPAIDFSGAGSIQVWTGRESYVRYEVGWNRQGAREIEGFRELSRYPPIEVETISVEIPLESTDPRDLLLMMRAIEDIPNMHSRQFARAGIAVDHIIEELGNWQLASDGRTVAQHKVELARRSSVSVMVRLLNHFEKELVERKQQLIKHYSPSTYDPAHLLLVDRELITLSETEERWLSNLGEMPLELLRYQELLALRNELIQDLKKSSDGRWELQLREERKRKR